MKTHDYKRFTRVAIASAASMALAIAGFAGAQQPAAPLQPAPPAREAAKEKVEAARNTQQGAREGIQDAREGARDTAREGRQDVRDTREGARDAGREGRETIRDARRDIREARREFIASRIRSGDLGLWLRRATSGLAVSDISNRGVISQTGLKEGDEIVSVNGQPVMSERQFIDLLFADHDANKPAQVVIKRGGQEQTISLQPKLFVAEHLADDNRLAEYGLILDESNPSQVKVQAVVPRSPAYYAGVRSGDQITSFSGERINALADLIRTLASATSGNSTSIDITRNNQPRQLEIEIPGQTTQSEPRTVLRPTLPNAGVPAPQTRPQPQPQPQLQPRNQTLPQPVPNPAPRPLPQRPE